VVRELVPCDLVIFEEFHPARRRYFGLIDPPEAHPVKPTSVFEQQLPQYPAIAHWQPSGDAGICKVSSLISRGDWHRLGIHQEFYRLCGVEDQMGFWLAFPKPGFVMSGLNRARRSFNERDRAILKLLRPHLVQAYHNAESASETGAERALMSEAMDSTGNGAVLVGDKNEIMSATPVALALFTKYFPNWRFHAHMPDLVARWLGSQWEALNGDEPASLDAFIIDGPNGRLHARAIFDPSLRRSVLVLREQLGRAADDAMGSQLPPRLRNLLQHIFLGESAKTIAEKLQLSRHTVHQYTKMLYSRMGVGSRGELMARRIAVAGKAEQVVVAST